MLRHGLLPAEGSEPGAASHPAAELEDGILRLEWDATLRTRVTRLTGRQRTILTSWGPSEYLLDDDGRHVTDFPLRNKAQSDITDGNGPGTRLTLTGMSAGGIEKAVTVTLYQRHPGIALVRATYRNTTANILTLRGWTNGDLRLLA